MSTVKDYLPLRRQFTFTRLLALSFGLSVAIFSRSGNAAPITWNGNTDTNFGVGGNWVGGVAPGTADVATFSGTPTANQPSVTTNITVLAVDLESGGWTIGGAATLKFQGGANSGITNAGVNHIAATIDASGGGQKYVAAAGSTLTLDRVTTSSAGAGNVTFGSSNSVSSVYNGTIVLAGTNDDSFLSPTVAYGTLVLNKASTNGSAVNNLTINAGATAKFGSNTDVRTPTERGQIFGNLTVNGTFDVNGTGTFTTNLAFGTLGGSGVITNSGSGPGLVWIAGSGGNYTGVIKDGSQPVSVYINASGNQNLVGGSASTYSGGLTIVAGQGRIANDGDLGLLPSSPTTDITINGPTARLMNSGGLLTVGTNRTILIGTNGGGFEAGFSANLVVNSVVTGSGPVTIFADSGAVVYNGTNTYTGPTIINNANLTLNNPCFDPGSTIYFTNTSTRVLNLNFNGGNSVSALWINGAQQANGTWGSAASGAANQSSLFTGPGVLNVVPLSDPRVSIPSITPSNTAYAGEIRLISAKDGGTAPFTNQWQLNSNGGGFVNIGSPTIGSLNTFTQDTTGLLGTYQYQVIVMNSLGSVTSSVAPLTVVASQPPTISQDTSPTNSASRYVGGTITFSALFYGNQPMTNQWQVDTGGGFTNIPGANASSLTYSNLQYGNAGNYRLVVSNVAGTSNSTPTTLTILNPAGLEYTWSAPVPFNGLTVDQILTNTLGGAQGIVGAVVFGSIPPVNVSLAGGNTLTFRNDSDGTFASCTGGGPSSGAYPGAFTGLSTGNTNFDTVLNQFRFDQSPKTISLNNLIVGQQYSVQLFALDDRAGNTNRRCYFQDGSDPAISVETSATYTMGTNAYVIATFTASNSTQTIKQYLPDSFGNMNALVLRAISFIPSNAPVVLTSPQPVQVFSGRPVQFSVTVDSFAPATYQWQTNGVNVGNGGIFSGANSAILTVTNTTGLNGVSFSVNVSNANGGPVSSGSAALTLLAVPPSSGVYASNSVLSLNPVAYWPFNETFSPAGSGTGGMPFYDAAGTHDGLYGALCYNAAQGIVGPQPTDGFPQFTIGQGAMSPAATTANTWGNIPPLNLTNNSVTFTMWIYPNGQQLGNAGLIFDRNAGEIGGFNLGGVNTNGYSALNYTWNNNDSGTWGHNSGLYVPTNQWSFVALVVTPSTTTWYMYNTNGFSTTNYAYANYGASSMTWNGSESSMWIGSDGGGTGTRNFNGTIDEVAVFNSALSTAQILSMASEAPVFLTQPTNLVVATHAPAQFSGTVSSLSAVTYQWNTNGVPVLNGGVFSGANSSTLQISDSTGLYGLAFSLSVTNTYAGIVSTNALLTVNVNSTPTNIISSVANGVLTLSWPADHTGWRLQTQTNSLTVGLSTNWVSVPNSSNTNSMTFPIGTGNGAVFYRMVYP